MRTLYQWPLSHYCEKVRWLLDYKELSFVAKNVDSLWQYTRVTRHSEQKRIPILYDNKQWIAPSSQIALYLDHTYPEHAYLRQDPILHQQALEFDLKANRIGNYLRIWLFNHLFRDDQQAVQIALGEHGIFHQLEQWTVPMFQFSMQHLSQLKKKQIDHAKQEIDHICMEFEQLLQQQSSPYLVGDRFGLADIALASLLAPIFAIKGTPWEFAEQAPAEVMQLRQRLQSQKLGEYVLKMYELHRDARVDWRGV